MRTLVWFRGKDLRVADHPALQAALRSGDVIPLFVLDPCVFAPARAAEFPHHSQFLLESVGSLAANLEARGSRLLLVEGESVEVVPRLARAWSADRVVAQRWAWPLERERDRRVEQALHVPFELQDGETLLPPGTLRSSARQPYSVFTRFAAAFRAQAEIGKPLKAPKQLPPLPANVDLATAPLPSLAALGLQPNPLLLRGGEHAARARLREFAQGIAERYDEERDRLDLASTSRLSADIKFGTLSVREVWSVLSERVRRPRALAAFQNELCWREFAYSTLWDRPELAREPFRADFSDFPWQLAPAHWEAWVQGKTGYPAVDAACRQLLGEGFVHNRARMIAASFLTKHLLIDYRRGEAHYMKYLTDADVASNNLGWQWSAGSGCDAQPYFRIFNPVTQGQKFDPDGSYVRRWVPELAAVPSAFIHRPWEAPAPVLAAAGVALGASYPAPIVEHRVARERFLELARAHFGRAAPPRASR